MREIGPELNVISVEQDTHTEVRSDEVIDWKLTLKALTKKESQVDAERSWGRLASNMRDICPETKWICIHESFGEEDAIDNIVAIENWLKALIVTPEWPFPQQVILISSASQERNWKILFPKGTKLPYATPPMGLTVTPFKDQYTSGWKIQNIETFNAVKAGEA